METYELYDLSIDMGELNNIVNQYPKTAKKLQLLLTNWLAENHNIPLVENPDWNKKMY